MNASNDPLMPLVTKCAEPFLVPPACDSTFSNELGVSIEIYRIVMLVIGCLMALYVCVQLWRMHAAGGSDVDLHDTTLGVTIQFSLHLRALLWSLLFILRMVDPTGVFVIYPHSIVQEMDYFGAALVFSIM